MDLGRRQVLAYRSPRDGAYQQSITVGRRGTLSPEAFPDLTLPVADLLG